MKDERSLCKIAEDIYEHWENIRYSAKPYLAAMLRLNKIDDMYGCEYGDMIVAYFLSNATYWRGEDARRIKKELIDMLDAYNKRR